MSFVIGGKGGGSGGSATIPSDLIFNGVDRAAAETARNAFFTASPARRTVGVTIMLEVDGAADALQQWTGTAWTDVTALVRGPQGNAGNTGNTGATGATITSGQFSGNDIVFNKSDATTAVLPNAVTTLKGQQGNDGATGPAGAKVSTVQIVADNFVFTNTDGSTFTLSGAVTSLKGATGATGANGSIGAQGFSAQAQYSADGVSGWTPTFTTGVHKFWRWSTDGGVTYSAGQRFVVEANTIPAATINDVGVVQIGGGLEVTPAGIVSAALDSSLKLTTNKIGVDVANIDVFSLKNAATLNLGSFRDNLNALSTSAALTNAVRGDFWIVNQAVTLLGTALNVGEQLWCTDTVVGVPVSLVSFAVVPMTLQQASTSVFGTVKIGGVTPLAATTTGVEGTSAAAARADHTHPQQAVPEASDLAGKDLGVAAIGTSTKYSREDHVHQDIPVFAGATTLLDGSTGRVPKPLIADRAKFLRGDATWVDIADQTVIVNNLTAGGTTSALSAEQGKVLNTSKLGVVSYTAKGTLVVGSGASTTETLAAGTNGQALIADSAQASGVKWGDVVQLAGDLGGTTATPLVSKIRGVDVSTTAPVAGRVLRATSSTASEWALSSPLPHDQTKAYLAGDLVTLGGLTCTANANISANTVFTFGTTGTTWSPQLARGTWRGVFADNTAYAVDDVVTHSANRWTPLQRVTTAFTSGTGTLLAQCRTAGGAHVGKVSFLIDAQHGSDWTDVMFVPATATVTGASGFVPSVAAGQNKHVFTGGGWDAPKVGSNIGRRNSGTQSIPSGVADGTVVLFPDTDAPAASFGTNIGLTYDNNTGNFTNTSGEPAVFLVSYQIIFPSGGTGWRSSWVRVSGTVSSRFAVDVVLTNADTGMPLSGTCTMALNNNGYFQICANHNNGTAISIGGAAAGVIAGITTRIQITRMTQ